jgi:hypothetical protein
VKHFFVKSGELVEMTDRQYEVLSDVAMNEQALKALLSAIQNAAERQAEAAELRGLLVANQIVLYLREILG